MEIFGLFPTPIGHAQLDRALTDRELTYINNLEKANNTGNIMSVNKKVLDAEELTDVKNFIQRNLNKYFEEVYKPKPEHEVEVYLTISWVNYTGLNQYHHAHNHPNSFISGCFYPKANIEHDNITFEKLEHRTIDIEPTEWNLWNSKTWAVGIGTGDLIFFPSNLRHFVKTKAQDESRISIAFNTFIRGKFGDDYRADSLVLT
jgi:uncharacterized protein (TIGR02466 family)